MALFNSLDLSSTFLIETSATTAPFLNSVREGLAAALHNKTVLGQNYGLRFNLGYFSRETTLWDDEAVPLSLETAEGALRWMKDWPIQDFAFTPRGRASQHSGPRVIPALVAALNDSSIRAVYMIAGSAPFEATNDIITHLEIACKDRPVNVLFLTGQRNVDFKAMEILHIISKETKGTFSIAYFDTYGQIIQVLKGEERRSPAAPLNPQLSQQLALIPGLYGRSNMFDGAKSSDDLIQIRDLLSGVQSKSGTFDDIKISLPTDSKNKRRIHS